MERRIFPGFCQMTAVLLVALLLGSCGGGSDDNTPEPEPPVRDEITLSGESATLFSEGLTFEVTPGSKTISFVTNQDWTVTVASGDWCTVSLSFGKSGSGSFTVSVKENAGNSDRNTTVTLAAGTAKKTLQVGQKKKETEPETPSDVTGGNEGYGEEEGTWDE